MIYIQAIEYITPLPNEEDTKAIIETGVAKPGQEIVQERLHPTDQQDFVIPVSPQCFMVELNAPKGVNFISAECEGEPPRRIELTGLWPVLIVPHPGTRLKLSIDTAFPD